MYNNKTMTFRTLIESVMIKSKIENYSPDSCICSRIVMGCAHFENGYGPSELV